MGLNSYEETYIDREELRERCLREADMDLSNVKIEAVSEEDFRRARPKLLGPGRDPTQLLLEIFLDREENISCLQ